MITNVQYTAFDRPQWSAPAMPRQEIITHQPPRAALLAQADHEHPALAYLAGLKSDRSRAVMRDDLAMVAALVLGHADPKSIPTHERRLMVFDVPWHELNITRMAWLQSQLTSRYSYRTVNRMMSAVRGVLKACRRARLMSNEDYVEACDLEPVKGATLPAGRDLSKGEREDLFDKCESDPTPAGARDAALLALADAGLRRAEIAAVDLAHYDRETGWLVVHGKGDKQREIFLEDGARRAVEDWIAVRGDEPGALLWPINKAGKMTPRRMSSQAIYNAMKKRGEQAGIKSFTPHDFRRTAAGDLLDAGADIVTVQKILGHASPDTTARYDRRSKEAKRKAANLRRTPYRGRRQQPLEG